VWDDDHDEMRPCEADPVPGSALGLCAEHEAQTTAAGTLRDLVYVQSTRRRTAHQ
jgi:hypothetical protein